MPRYVWGVDSAATADEELYTFVKSKLGNPKFWGRYLSEVPDVSAGLTRAEISFLRNRGIKVLPIYNVFSDAIGYEKGQIAARNAVFNARRLGIPNNVALFASVERFSAVDEAWIRGWVESIYPSGFRPGLYNDPVKGDFSVAYCEAVRKNRQIAVQTILWSAEPEPGVTKERNAPTFKPISPKCKANVWVWQYGKDSEDCPIDTNLADQRALNYLY
ncbi:glycoside hydrolase domain-containing protein [Fredinandcohnia onubensis]|uniref:glycoside hydrolase domain-containing protein n=1 Tax=Fredinandcohnia onubensis TaxID=1571209 RepID=UPI000C0BF1B9|nr:glycoside hydrolase domain-containing protein [Fredinandcohnia onubensis]